VQKDAKDNVDFLEKQLITVADPLLREKLQGMIAAEIEKAMIISKEAYKVIDRPFCVRKYKEKIMYPAAAALGMFMISSAAVIFLYYVAGGGNTNSESRRWVGLIRRELFRIF
jgi:3-methyladenine DNA glycosylase Mpg